MTNNKLIKVVKTLGNSNVSSSTVLKLDPGNALAEIRSILVGKQFMAATDNFMWQGAPLSRDQEPDVTLSDVLSEDGTTLNIGQADDGLGDDPESALQRYQTMLPSQKTALLARVEIYRGLTITKDGMKRTAERALVPLHEEDVPAGTRVVATSTVTDHSFNEVTSKLMESSTTTASVELSTPYGGGDASFEYAKSHSEDSKTVKEYLVGKKLFQKVKITFDHNKLALMPDFEQALKTYMQRDDSQEARAYQLVRALNERGYYVPRVFTLGGALLTSETTEITEFHEVDTERTKFEAGVNASYGGISGGAKGGHESETSNEHGETNKYNSLKFTQVSGEAVDPESLPDFIASLMPAANWDVILHEDLCPTLSLIKDNRMRNYCFRLLDKYGTYPQLMTEQPYLDLLDYSTRAQSVYDQYFRD
jgi:hypothetical protein